ncbi:MAG: 2-hydroxy-acid oxidase, partial [Clostridiaceae bacterium]|nr:2-hydroxy-acid oxidase [Clostridiaceae bacterium]
YVLKDELTDAAWEKKLEEVFEAMYKKSRELKGLVSGEHGIGFAKKEYMLEQYGPEYINLMKNIKLAFDPKNILNPGKVCQ